jgi:putative spermidine/putrescine transport system substrate-binding protein
MKHFSCVILTAFCLCTVLFGACSQKKAVEKVDLASLSMDELIAGAKKEGAIESLGMPEDWANWGESWDKFTTRYGLTHSDIDMSSAEEIAMFKAEADSPTKDITDIGFGFVRVAIEEDVVQPYKPRNWDKIPTWAKDPEGRWIVYCSGTSSWIINTNLTKGRIPRTWKELREGDYVLSIGTPVQGGSSQAMVISAAYAFGGDLNNVRPGIEFFKELARTGRITGASGREPVLRGEIEINASFYDYSTLAWRDYGNSQGTANHFEVIIPQDGAITVGSCLIFNKYSPHPHATALMYEYAFSEEGQLDRARGFARPIMDVSIPPDLQAKMLSSSEYQNAIPVNDPDALTRASREVARLWDEEVIPLIN